MTEEIEKLKVNIFSDDWELVKDSQRKLTKIGGEDVLVFFISLLKLDDAGIRNRAALALEELKDQRALEPLLDAIFKRRTIITFQQWFLHLNPSTVPKN